MPPTAIHAVELRIQERILHNQIALHIYDPQAASSERRRCRLSAGVTLEFVRIRAFDSFEQRYDDEPARLRRT
jgi:hypothetical protein